MIMKKEVTTTAGFSVKLRCSEDGGWLKAPIYGPLWSNRAQREGFIMLMSQVQVPV
jgi:hypothetical protein